jgi:hypothetical protein
MHLVLTLRPMGAMLSFPGQAMKPFRCESHPVSRHRAMEAAQSMALEGNE